MKLNIQMFADEADNASDIDTDNDTDLYNEKDIVDNDETDVDLDNVDTEDTEEDESSIADGKKSKKSKKAETKAFSERLNKERERIRLELEAEQKAKLDAIARARNFESWEELEEYDEQERLARFGVEDTDEFKLFIDDLISKNPIVKEAQAILAQQREKEKETFIKEQITAISQIDNSIKSLDDLVKIDRYDDFKDKVDKGYSLVDAYKIIYFDKIKLNEIEAAKQNVLNNIDSKSHMKNATGASGKEIHIPEDVMAMYKKNIPNMSEAEIRKHYAKYIGGNE